MTSTELLDNLQNILSRHFQPGNQRDTRRAAGALPIFLPSTTCPSGLVPCDPNEGSCPGDEFALDPPIYTRDGLRCHTQDNVRKARLSNADKHQVVSGVRALVQQLATLRDANTELDKLLELKLKSTSTQPTTTPAKEGIKKKFGYGRKAAAATVIGAALLVASNMARSPEFAQSSTKGPGEPTKSTPDERTGNNSALSVMVRSAGTHIAEKVKGEDPTLTDIVQSTGTYLAKKFNKQLAKKPVLQYYSGEDPIFTKMVYTSGTYIAEKFHDQLATILPTSDGQPVGTTRGGDSKLTDMLHSAGTYVAEKFNDQVTKYGSGGEDSKLFDMVRSAGTYLAENFNDQLASAGTYLAENFNDQLASAGTYLAKTLTDEMETEPTSGDQPGGTLGTGVDDESDSPFSDYSFGTDLAQRASTYFADKFNEQVAPTPDDQPAANIATDAQIAKMSNLAQQHFAKQDAKTPLIPQLTSEGADDSTFSDMTGNNTYPGALQNQLVNIQPQVNTFLPSPGGNAIANPTLEIGDGFTTY